jgi:stage II sporulation protein D
MMRRDAFLASVLLGLAVPKAARATGGLDVEATPGARAIRVLLASDAAIQPEPIDAWHFSWDGRTYRGSFAPVALDGGATGVMNLLPLEAYLYGVVSKEISPAWPAAAQQVQAILSRTYALTRLRPNRPFDVGATQSDQRYDGIEGESVEAHDAVDATAGLIVSFDGAPAGVAYSACCGGHTADAADVWGTSVPYLRSVADANCVGTPDFSWSATIPPSGVAKLLTGRPEAPLQLQSIELRDIDPSGRPRTIALAGDGASLSMKATDFRSAVGTDIVHSTLIRSAVVQDGAIELTGNGRGHGVGLCQWGARELAARAALPADILQFYFAGTSLAQM